MNAQVHQHFYNKYRFELCQKQVVQFSIFAAEGFLVIQLRPKLALSKRQIDSDCYTTSGLALQNPTYHETMSKGSHKGGLVLSTLYPNRSCLECYACVPIMCSCVMFPLSAMGPSETSPSSFGTLSCLNCSVLSSFVHSASDLTR